MKIVLSVCLMSIFLCMLFAQVDNVSRDSGRLPSLVIQANDTNVNNFILVKIADNKPIPILDMSRQYLEPGTYSLSHQQWGYHNFRTEFYLNYGDDKNVIFTPTPIDQNLIKKYDRLSRQSKIFLVTSIATIGCAGVSKGLGDKEYDRYKKATDLDDIANYRESSNIYQIAFLASSSICITSTVTWVCTQIAKKTAKTRVYHAMQQ